MAKRPGGSQCRQHRGLKVVGVPVTSELHAAVRRAAGLADPPTTMGAWAAAELEKAARRLLRKRGVSWPDVEGDRR